MSARKVYRKVSKTLHIDSRDRNPLCSQSSYTVKLPKTYENVYSVTLKSAEIPFSWYVFSANNGNTTFQVGAEDGTGLILITIENGNYTGAELATELTDKLTAAGGAGVGVTVTYSTQTNRFTFSKATSFSLDFTGTQTQATCGAPTSIQNTSTWWGLGYFLGFNKKVYTGTSITSDFTAQLNAYNYLLLELEFINKQDETPVDSRLSGRVDGCFAKVPITGNSGDVIFFREHCCPLNRSVLSPPLGQLRTLQIKWRDHNGRLLEFNNADHSFTLEFELLDNNFDEYSSLDFTPRN